MNTIRTVFLMTLLTVVLVGAGGIFGGQNGALLALVLAGVMNLGSYWFSDKIVISALQLHQKVASNFLPTAIKFHYIFNLRDLSNIFQGLLFATSETIKVPIDFVRLWLHEASRVYGDKFVEEKDMETFNGLKIKVVRDNFEVNSHFCNIIIGIFIIVVFLLSK